MDFRQSVQPNPRPNPTPAQPTAAVADTGTKPHSEAFMGDQKNSAKWLKIFTVVMLLGIAVLIACIALGIGRSSGSTSESKYVNTSKYQAVFLTNGQVYFGNVDSLNDQYIHMTNIYYLTQATNNDGSKSSNYSLVKLGCQQIHDPSDAMTINRSQVNFWENLEDNGKVVTSIKQFKQQNPNGPDCSQVSNQTQADSNASTQGTDNTATGTNSSTSSGTTKK